MNILVDVLPKTVKVEGSTYALNTDFRIGIMFELLMQDRSIMEEEKPYLALDLFYKDSIPPNIKEAIEGLKWFYSRGAINQDDDEEDNKIVEKTKKQENIYSYDHDDEFIYSAFLTQYGIDLQEVEDLHWWKFKALFKTLNENLLFSKIMGYRSMTISSEMSDSDKKYYRKMKKVYALPDERTEEEKQEDFNNSLSSVF